MRPPPVIRKAYAPADLDGGPELLLLKAEDFEAAVVEAAAPELRRLARAARRAIRRARQEGYADGHEQGRRDALEEMRQLAALVSG